MPKPLVSVVMPARNAAAFLAEAIASVRAQTLSTWELLVIDDGSTDETPTIPGQFSDDRIRVLPNSSAPGVSGAANTGTSAAVGRYLARMDADDVMTHDRLERQARYLDRHAEVVLCGSWLELFGAETGTWRYPERDASIKALLLFQCCIGQPSVMLRRDVLQQRGLTYDTELSVGEDYDLWMRLSSGGQFHCIQEVLTRYRRHPRQLTAKSSIESQRILASLRRRWLCRLFGEIDGRALETHERVATLAYLRDPGFVDSTSGWFEELLTLNRERPAFDQDALREVLVEKLYDVCTTIAPLGPAVYARLRRSALGRRLSWHRGAWVLAKALLCSSISWRAAGDAK